MENKQSPSWTVSDVFALFKADRDPEKKALFRLYALGILLTPITLGGALWGYRLAYSRKLHGMGLPPSLAPIHPFARLAMLVGAIGIWICIVGGIVFLSIAVSVLNLDRDVGVLILVILMYMIVNGSVTFALMFSFRQWRNRIYASLAKLNTFGSARMATAEDIDDLGKKNGIYIGAGYAYSKQGHLISVAGTRSGKFTNLIAPNLLGASNYEGSWFVIDPKGECAFVTARYQKELGKTVIVLDPWKVHSQTPDTYNPLDILLLGDSESLADDASMIAEMLIPQNPQLKDPFFSDRARSIISGLIMHHALVYRAWDNKSADPEPTFSLVQIWRWVRLPQDDFAEVLQEMSVSDNETVRATGNECMTLITNSSKTYASVLSEIHTQTDFLKSPALQANLQTSMFDMQDMTEGNAAVYVIIPPDKVDSHSKWLRLIVGTALRDVVRHRNKRVTFILDEFPSLGKINDVSSFMAMGAGYNITLWPIFQSLSQLEAIYGKGWQVFMAGATVKHFFGVGDNFSAEYISKMAGDSTYIVYDNDIVGPDKSKPQARPLITPDEVRRGSSDKIFTFIEQRPVAVLPKFPYYDMRRTDGRADPNPYYVPD